MIGMQYNTNLQAKGVLEIGCFASSIPSTEAKCKKDGNFTSNEPISVLDNRSPSPSTSTSTLSSSFGGTNGGGNSDNTPNLVVGSHKNTLKEAVPLDPTTTASAANGVGGGGLKEEWVTELPSNMELSQAGPERFNLGLEDWEAILSESTGQDQSLMRWISGDFEDPSSFSLKQLLQGGNSKEIQGNVGFDGIDQSSGLEALVSGNVLPTLNSSNLGFSDPGISLNNKNAKFGSDSSSTNLKINNGSSQNPNFSSPPNKLLCMPNNGLNNVAHQQQLQFATTLEQKSQNFMPQVMVSTPQFQNGPSMNILSSLWSCANQDQPQPKRQNLGILNPVSSSQIPKVSLIDPGSNFLLRKQQEPQVGLGQQLNLIPSSNPQQNPLIVPKQEVAEGNGNPLVAHRHHQQQQQVVYDQLYKATELIMAGNFSHAQGILARLNHQLSPAVKPFQRAAFYFKEALQLLLLMPNRASSTFPRVPTPLDGIFKMGAYKMLSEVSPLVQFMNFTSNQVLLEALENAERIHIIDFDIGCGAQWSSFMQELPRRNRGQTSLKITAFASPSTCHSVEISLIHESLTHFANDLGINFELEVVNFDSFDPRAYSVSSFRSSESDAIAVNFPLWAISSRPTILPLLLSFIKKLSPKIVVMLDHGSERFELPPCHHLLNALQYYEVLLDSIDAANMASDAASEIERFLIKPRIESIVFGRLQFPNQIPPGASLFSSAGFSSVPISNFAEAQADCIVKRSQVGGFHLEKHQASLVLCWQRRELLSASVWKC